MLDLNLLYEFIIWYHSNWTILYPNIPFNWLCLQKCVICGKGKKSPNGATAGCAVQTCRKSFHFYCARTTATTVARKMIETVDSGTEIDRYLWVTLRLIYCCLSLKLWSECVHDTYHMRLLQMYCIMYKKSRKKDCLQCFDAVGWVAGRASGL